MSHSNWTVLALVFCLGACQGPESQGPGALSFGQRCDVEVRNDHALLSVAAGWTERAADFYVEPRSDADWAVDIGNNQVIKELDGGSRYFVRIDADERRVWIGGTAHEVVRRETKGRRGILVNPTGGGATEVVFWLMVGKYAYKIVMRKRP